MKLIKAIIVGVIVGIFSLPPQLLGQVNYYLPHISPYSFRYSSCPHLVNLYDVINRQRIQENRIRSCSITKEIRKKRKIIVKKHLIEAYFYDSTGFCLEFHSSNVQGKGKKWDYHTRRNSPTFLLRKDSLAKLAERERTFLPEFMKLMPWQGWGIHSEGEALAVGAELVTTYEDSARQLTVKEYWKQTGPDNRILHKENQAGMIVEIEGFLKTGERVYLKRRIKIPRGYETQLIGETPEGNFIRSITYDSLGYQIRKGNLYYPKDSTKKQLRIAKKFSNYYEYTYDENYYPLAEIHYIRGKVYERKDYYYDNKKNRTKVISQYHDGEVEIEDYTYTYW